MAFVVDPRVRPGVELYGAASCPYTGELREHLRWRRIEFVEYDVEADGEARARLRAVTGGQMAIPVLVEQGRVTSLGWRGRSCIVGE